MEVSIRSIEGYLYFCPRFVEGNRKPLSNYKAMNEPKQIEIENYDYPLPDERIARYPLEDRAACRLLVYRSGEISSSQFRQITDFIPEHSLLIRNNTRVIRARIHVQKPSGAQIEIMCLEPANPAQYERALSATSGCSWHCLVGNARRWKEGPLETLVTLPAEPDPILFRIERGEGDEIHFSWNSDRCTFGELLSVVGILPIPPYLHRETEESDKTNYQTVYAQCDGSVAAPTAGLHFTPELFESLKAKGVSLGEITLHVGAGTFMPVKTTKIGDHRMHQEVCRVERSIVATTSVRTLESLYLLALNHVDELGQEGHLPFVAQWEPYETDYPEASMPQVMSALLRKMDSLALEEVAFSTALLIAPGYTFRVVEGMVTNFHQPKSTLLLMISAFLGEDWKRIYDYALSHDYRFLSYGDGSLLLP